jgi:hypothetical protein
MEYINHIKKQKNRFKILNHGGFIKMDLSNKSLALLLVAAIVITLGGTLVSLSRLNELGITGGATSGVGQVNLTVSSNASCTVSTNIIFGSARPTANTSISTDFANNVGWDGTLCNGASNASCTGLIINNTGNTLLNITYNTSKLGPAFLDSQHTNASFRYMVDNTEGGAGCTGTLGPVAWTTVLNNATATGNTSALCNNLNYLPAPNAIIMDFNMSILQNITSGAKTTDITITCTQN